MVDWSGYKFIETPKKYSYYLIQICITLEACNCMNDFTHVIEIKLNMILD